MALIGSIGSTIAKSVLPAGSVLQVVTVTNTASTSQSLATGSFTSPIMTLSITPTSASSKIFVSGMLHATADTQRIASRITRTIGGSTSNVLIGVAAGSRTAAHSGSNAFSGTDGYACMPLHGLDSPNTTSECTYNVQLGHGSGSTVNIRLNARISDPDESNMHRLFSCLTLMEIAG
jgi:hypothetical protein